MKQKIGVTVNGIEEKCTILDGTCRRHVVHRADTFTKSQLSAKELKLFTDLMLISTDLYTDSTGREVRTHHKDKCAGQNCSIHNPSAHPLKNAPTVWRDDLKMMERICTHGVGHPDPDDVAYNVGILGKDENVYASHGCDGCCTNSKVQEPQPQPASAVTKENDLLPWTGVTLKEARSKLSGLHFAKEGLTDGEREILYIAEALLRRLDEINDNSKN